MRRPRPHGLRHFLSTLAIGWSGIACAAGPGGKTLAVLELSGPGIPRADLTDVSNRLGRSLAATGRYRFVEPDSSRARPAADSASSGSWWKRSPGAAPRPNRETCSDMDCALRVGARRKVDRVLFGVLEARGAEWILTTRMMDVGRTSTLLRTEFRTEEGLLDLMDRGLPVVASRYDSAEVRLEALVAKTPPGRRLNPRDSARDAELERRLGRWRPVAAVTGGVGLGALYLGAFLRNNALDDCRSRPLETCKDPNRALELRLLGASAALGAVALVSGTVVLLDLRRQNALKEKSILDVSWAPVWDPGSKAVGLATRLEF